MTRKSELHKRDTQYKRAKAEGYRARSAYKLLEIQKKFNIFKRAFYILDLGSAPGSWLQVARKFAEENLEKYRDQHYYRDHFKIMGIDLKNISPIEDVKTLRLDLCSEKVEQVINDFFPENLDLILSDASINKMGNAFTDQLRQVKLCYRILEIAKHGLKYKGVLLIKAFQGTDFKSFVEKIKEGFFQVKIYKPKTSKKQSNEIYLIGLKKK
ncbi:MAG: RlmE family RNA methyltransferase [Promethearchaeota archaeon]|nr:MAG: RlmE family RNA methyltransferase [Candidatus Lokiarchaeota archaeon]